MSRVCELTGKGPMVGNNVSHAKNRTRRRFLPNLNDVTLQSEALGRGIKFRISASALRSVDHRGGLDAYLAKAKDTELSVNAQKNQKRDCQGAGCFGLNLRLCLDLAPSAVRRRGFLVSVRQRRPPLLTPFAVVAGVKSGGYILAHDPRPPLYNAQPCVGADQPQRWHGQGVARRRRSDGDLHRPWDHRHLYRCRWSPNNHAASLPGLCGSFGRGGCPAKGRADCDAGGRIKSRPCPSGCRAFGQASRDTPGPCAPGSDLTQPNPTDQIKEDQRCPIVRFSPWPAPQHF